MRKRLFTAILCLIMALTSLPQVNAAEAASDASQQGKALSGFQLMEEESGYINDISSFALAAGSRKTLELSYDFYGTTEIAATEWTSSNELAATVSQTGEVTAVNTGTAVITASYTTIYGNIVSYSAVVTVTSPAISTNKVIINLYGLEKNEEGYYNAYDSYVSFEGLSSNSVVTCDTGSSSLQVSGYGSTYTFYPKKKGTYTAKFNVDGRELTCTVVVANVYFKRNSKSTADGESTAWVPGNTMLAMYKGETATLKAKGFPSGAKIKWTSSNKSVAKVNTSGKVTAKANGYATITASSQGISISYEVGVSYKTAVKALRYATKHYSSTYSQPKRMQTGYYDCSSYVWRSYKAAGKYIGGDTTNAPTAAGLANWSVNNGYMILEGTVDVSKLLPGDLIFWTGANNGRYKGIYHVDFYAGNYSSITVARSKFFGEKLEGVMVARPCSTTPTSSKAKSSVFSNCVTFSGAYGADGYVVYRSTSKNGPYTKIGKTKNGSNSYEDTNVTEGKKYYYKARPYWSGSKRYYGRYSPVSSCKKTTGTPAFEVSSTELGVKITWDKVAGADGYYIYRNNGSGKFKKIGTVTKGSSKSYVDTTAKAGKTYRYKLVAYKGKTKSGSSKNGTRIKYTVPKTT